MIFIIITITLGSFIGWWMHYASKEMSEEPMSDKCKNCPFANNETGCCDHQLWSPSICLLSTKKRK